MAQSIRVLLLAAVVALLAFPAAAPAKKGHGGKLHRNAVQMCKQLRTDMGARSFRSAYGSDRNRKAFRHCVKRTKRALKRARRSGGTAEAVDRAQDKCRAELADDPEVFDSNNGDQREAGDDNKAEDDFADCVDDHADDENEDEDEGEVEDADDGEVDQPEDERKELED